MARPIATRLVNALRTSRLQVGPGTEVTPVEYWRGPKGINSLAKISQVPNEYAVSITNLMLDQGYLRSRYGNEILGAPDPRVQAVLSFTPANGSGVLIRLRLDGADSWNGLTWLPITGLVFTANPTDRFTWTGWGDELLISNGAEKIVSYNVVTGLIETLVESPPARHLSSFNGRVIASAVTEGSFFGYRIRWSVKLNNRDWTAETTIDAIGAGFEDLLASPGGVVDEVMGVYPLSDETALVVRENSLWLMFVTGNVDAPFRFSKLTGEVGSRSRHANVLTPFGVVMLSREDVLIVDQSGPKSIGVPIRRELFSSDLDFRALTGAYDPRRQEYRLAVGTTMWRYSWRDQGWTRDLYDMPVKHLSFVDYKSLGLTFDQLVGEFDELEGTFDDLGISIANESMHMVHDSSGQAIREGADLSRDNELDAPIEIVSGLLAAGSVLEKTGIIEAQLEYECDEAQRVWFDYSVDKGVTWVLYSYIDIVPTAGPRIAAVRHTLESHNLQIRARSSTLGKLSLISLTLMTVKGARVNH